MSKAGLARFQLANNSTYAAATRRWRNGEISEDECVEIAKRVGSDILADWPLTPAIVMQPAPSTKRPAVAEKLPAGITGSRSKEIDHQKLNGLFRAVGWPERDQAAWEETLAQSVAVYSLWDKDTLVAFGRATEDEQGILLCDGVVAPGHQGKGLLRELLKVADELVEQHGYQQVRLMAAPDTQPIYEHFGWEPATATHVEAMDFSRHSTTDLEGMLGRISRELANRTNTQQ